MIRPCHGLCAGMVLMLFVLCSAECAQAHGVTITTRVLSEEAVVTALCRYSTGEPMAYAAIKVHGPGYMDVEFQNGRTDALGRFAFVPAEHGAWRIQVDDGMGHRHGATIEIGQEEHVPVSSSMVAPPGLQHTEYSALGALHALPVWLAALFGVSLIANVFGVVARLKKRRI